jgi:hypothetical protein
VVFLLDRFKKKAQIGRLENKENKMKKALLIAAASLISASAIAQVTSANIVGYVKVDTVGQKLVLPGSQFIIGSGNTVTETLGTNVPLGTKIFSYDPVAQSYKGDLAFTYITETQFIPPATIVTITNGIGWTEGANQGVSDRILNVGEGFWIQSGAAEDEINEIVIAGEVIVDGSVANDILPGLNLICSPYSAETAVTNFGFNPVIGDTIYSWTGAGYAGDLKYDYITETQFIPPATIVTVTNGIGWTEGANQGVSDRTIGVAEGFWYESVASVTNEWVMDRPFNLD